MRSFQAILRGADRPSCVVLLGGSLFMTLYLYQGHPDFFLRHFAPPEAERSEWWEWYAHLWEFGVMLLVMGVLPAMVSRRVLHQGLHAHGVRLGDWRFGLKTLLVVTPILVPVLYVNSLSPEFQAEYPLTKLAGLSAGTFVLWELSRFVYYVAWEYFFRGFMLFGLRKRFGDFAAIAIQTVPSTIIHIGKPEGEMLAAIVAGVLFGALAIRTRSILWPLLIHFIVGGLVDGFCLLSAP